MNRKLVLVVIISLVISFLGVPLFSQSLKGISFGGTTGLITTPTGRIGWEQSTDLGLDVGYHFSTDRAFGDNESILNLTFGLFKILELGGTFDLQPGTDESDILFFGKYQMFNDGNSGMALGGSFQLIDLASNSSQQFGQIYLASTYSGDFMNTPAATTLVFGKTFNIAQNWNNQIDFSMGFDLSLFPEAFHGYLHWISEFSNYSYSADSRITNADSRGAFNTGIRIDIMPSSPFKFVVDATLMDVFDLGINNFAVGGSFGFSLR
ncbi:MAG: hypothetical protein DRP58_05115 [Spirochaetes bacterium]|nr:MAG: hypothetical protein DRP58_05115 [Spirochaetota bacterium]